MDYIQLGNPQQNVYIERYNRTVRYDWLAQRLFDSIEQVQLSATRRLWIYDHERPNMAIGGITPMQKLAMAAQLHFSGQLELGGLPPHGGIVPTGLALFGIPQLIDRKVAPP